MIKNIKEVLIFVGMGLIITVIFNHIPISDWSQGWFSGLLTVLLYGKLMDN